MPTYVYQCKTCSHQFEKVQSFHDTPLTECSTCGGEVRRVIFPSGVIFKGSGWYITDSRKSGESKAATTSTKSAAGETSSTTSEGSSSGESGATKTAEKATAATDS